MPSFLKKVTQANPPTQNVPDAVLLKQPKNTERSSPKNSGGEVKKGRYFDLPLPTHKLLNRMKCELERPLSDIVNDAILAYAEQLGID